MIKLSVSTHIFFAYSGSRACSASINAATHHIFCASAIACSVNVVFQDDSGQYISIILPFAYHHQSAISRDREPEDVVSIFIHQSLSHNLIIDHFQNCFSIISIAFFKASCLFINKSNYIIKIIYIKNMYIWSIYEVYKKSKLFLNIFYDL
jgi:hypothetical protein